MNETVSDPQNRALTLLSSLTIFRGVLRDPAVAALRAFLRSKDAPVHARVERYSVFARALLDAGGNWSDHLLARILCDENPYILRVAEGTPPPENLSRQLENELAALQEIGRLTSADLTAGLDCGVPLMQWETSGADYAREYRERAARVHELGYGMFAEHHAFRLNERGLEPVRNPDPVDFDTLAGYEREREAVLANTLALVEGRPAANVLLYGDSGTGKSTCVKAIANRLRGRGLRLIELRKDQLFRIPELLDSLSRNPLKFILFVDDLSFAGDGDSFSALKAVLEGSVSARTANMAIYATSNRRHLVRETFSARGGDDVHLRDTLEEHSSLADRFGLTVTFLRPDRELYVHIARRYLRAYGAQLPEHELAERAEAFALGRGGRSPRTAKQFAESIASGHGAAQGENA
jgi:predicted AAA+ superfamily ATPase